MGLTDDVKRMLESIKISSAGDTNRNINVVVSIDDVPDLEASLKQLEQDDPEISERNSIIDKTVGQVTDFGKGNVGEVQRMTSQQFGNIRSFALNPFQFMIQSVFSKFKSGAGIGALALVFFEVVKFIISELLKPGRFLDRRFKRIINNEILSFRSREEKQKIRQGLTQIIVTTMPRLRNGANQSTNTLRQASGLDAQTINSTFTQPRTADAAAGIPMSLAKGRRRFGQ